MPQFTATGFEDRDQDYTKAMTWVVETEGQTVTMQLNGTTHFGRKHLLLPSRDTTKAEEDKKQYGWGIWWLMGWKTGVDDHVENKSRNRLTHRQQRKWNAGQGTQERRWAEKYKSHAPANTVLNLVTISQKSISAEIASVAFAKNLIALGLSANGDTGTIDVDFGRQCVVHVYGNGTISHGSSLKVVVKLVGANTYEFMHLSH